MILLAFFVAFAFGPTIRNLDATSKLKKREAELEKQRSITRVLDRETEEAKSMSYVEREARRQRMVFPGEILYLITNESSDEERQRTGDTGPASEVSGEEKKGRDEKGQE